MTVGASWRDALLGACLPGGPGRPGVDELDLAAFWRRFEATAPAHLKAGLWLATWVLGLLPLVLFSPPLPWQGAERRDATLRRLSRWPGVGELVEVAKVVACLACFFDPGVQQAVRS